MMINHRPKILPLTILQAALVNFYNKLESINKPLPLTLTPFFQDERVIKRIGEIYYLFGTRLIHSPNQDIVKVTAINLVSNDEYSVEIFPSDIFGKYTKTYFEKFCSEIFIADTNTTSKTTVHELTQKMIESRGKFVKSLLWLKLLISQAIKGQDRRFISDAYYIGYNELSTYGKFAKFDKKLKAKKKEDIAAIILGIGSEGKFEFGIQMPKILSNDCNYKILGQINYLEEFSKMSREVFDIDKYSLPEECIEKNNITESMEKIIQLEKQCKELRIALREAQGTKKDII